MCCYELCTNFIGFTLVTFVIFLQGNDGAVCFSLSNRLNASNLKEVSLS